MAKEMRQECLDQVGQILGRRVTPSEGREILQAVRSTMATLSRTDPDAWAKMTIDDRVSAAADQLAKQIEERAQRRAINLRKQALAQDRLLHKMERLEVEEDLHAYSAVAKLLQETYGYAKGVTNEYLSSMLDTINGIRSSWLGFVENKEDVRDFVYEAFGQATGNERAAKAWEAFSATAENMRQRAVAAGADIGRLDYGYIPQSHDSWKVRKAAKILTGNKNGDSKEAWTNFILPLLDRSRYVDDAGERMSDADLRELLSGAYDDIITAGSLDTDLFEIQSNQPKLVSNRFKKYHHRTIHFADADSYLKYEAQFGNGSLTGALTGHVAKMANDIAILEKMGPKPKATYQMLKYVADRVAENAQASESKWKLLTKYSDWQGLTDASIDDMWNVLTGIANRAALNREGVAGFMQGWRNLEMAGKLGKAFITSFSDIPSYFVATKFNRLPLLQGAKFFIAAYGSDWREYAARAGIIAENLTSDFNRWSVDNIGQGWTAKLANASMRASLLNAFTDGTRRAFSLNMMASLAKMTKNNWDELDNYDRARLQDAGITEADWEVFQAAQTETYKGIEFLTINNLQAIPTEGLTAGQIRAVREAPAKLLGLIIQESEMASLGPDLVTRAETTRGAQRGTMKGELARAFFLFKSFPLAMMERHFRRASFLARHGNTPDKVSYAAGMVVVTTIFGAISLQIQNLLNGKDFQDVWDWDFVLNSMAKGGGLGFLGDFIANGLSEDARYGAWSGLTNVAGPQVGTVVETVDLFTATMGNALYDRETRPGARAVRLVRSHMPFVNLWYTGTAIDRAVMNDLQEYLSPGYNQRMESRMMRSWGQGYWWGPRDTTPRRSPRMATAPD